MAYCAKCGATTQPGDAHCRSCGAPLAAEAPGGVTYSTQGPVGAPAQVAYAPPAPLPPHLGKPIEQSTAILALVLNIIVWPGLGSLIAGENVGWTQGLLNLLGLVLIFTIIGMIIGIPLMIAMWVWGIVTGVQLINRAGAQQQFRATAGPR